LTIVWLSDPPTGFAFDESWLPDAAEWADRAHLLSDASDDDAESRRHWIGNAERRAAFWGG
jgi:hypothetical protein